MNKLQVIRLKPNPRGKDRPRQGSPTPAQLGGEWVDVKNLTASPLALTGVKLYHLAVRAGESEPKWAEFMSFNGSLGVGKVMRVHSGRTRAISVLDAVDLVGADHHLFSGRDAYVWNNAEGDTAGLWKTEPRSWIDRAYYDPHPPEGVVLVRSGSKLVPVTQAASWRLG